MSIPGRKWKYIDDDGLVAGTMLSLSSFPLADAAAFGVSINISNPLKLRRLKRFAVKAQVDGFVKTGKPGVLVFDGPKESIKAFLELTKGLRYLDFRHVDTKPIKNERLLPNGDGSSGLQEVADMNELVNRLDRIGEKEWFREQMGMSKGTYLLVE
ncbi:hypothetical protein JR316_0006203 [Psilocybe cubensis]|uniref:Uncharacterized protein n=2 Tax=Psilocybe cubensis TaxID=181762 RepID=A0ACB8H2F7_PSICU|nr:hypothetical protein JR316_0006203 [Psilocybe cubensis]KAH9481676.1 hypothetical protein JR316_0006203 [Psilocybe cubensis]